MRTGNGNKQCGKCRSRKPGDTLPHSAGYVLEYAPDHPRAHNGYVYQHVLVWERANRRLVPAGHAVHHRNEIRDDNRPENLEVLTVGAHNRRHLSPERLRRMQAAAVAARHANGTYYRGDHCAAGHEYTEANTYRWGGARQCRTCRRRRDRERRAALRAAA